MTKQLDISISLKQQRTLVGLPAVLSADSEHYTITATDSPIAGKFTRRDTTHRVKPFSFRVAVSNDKGEGYLHSLTKEALYTLVLMTLLAVAAIAATFIFNTVWWLMLPPLTLNALVGAYLAQKTYVIASYIS